MLLKYLGIIVLSAGLFLRAAAPASTQTLINEAWFSERSPDEIKAALETCSQTDFSELCQGLVDAAFNKPATAQRHLNNWLQTSGKSSPLAPSIQAHLASSLILAGYYGQGAELYQQLLQLPLPTAAKESLSNAEALFSALKHVPPIAVVAPLGKYPLRWDKLSLPRVRLTAANQAQAEAILDTGANLSTISVSQAKRLGLKLIATPITIKNSTDKSIPSQLAFAEELRMGKIQLKNLPFLVVADSDLAIFPEDPIQLILGLPVLLKLGRIKLHQQGVLEIAPTGSESGPENLYLDQFQLMTRVQYADTQLCLQLDTGARSSNLNSDFQAKIPNWQSLNPEQSSRSITGVGGKQELQVLKLGPLDLKLGERVLHWPKIDLLNEGSQKCQGLLGHDGLQQTGAGFELDFVHMRLDLL
jgi:hypothetical protein